MLPIDLTKEFQDDGLQLPPQIRLRLELLFMILEDLEIQRHLLQIGRDKQLSWSQLENIVDAMNRAEYHLLKLESPIEEAL